MRYVLDLPVFPLHPILTLFLSCASAPPPVTPPEAHSWKAEAELVVAGLESVQSLWEAGQRPAAKILAERVYTERFEPRLEPALRQMDGPKAAAQFEYSFGRLTAVLDGKDRARVESQVDALQRQVRGVAEAASSVFPASGQPVAAPAPKSEAYPVVPDVPPNWEAVPEPAE